MSSPAVNDTSVEAARETTALLPPGLVFADTWSRIAAYALDAVLLSVIVSIPPAFFGFYDTVYTDSPYPDPIPRDSFVLVTLFSFAVTAAYFLWFWSGGRRATPGQRVFDIQVANAFDGHPLTAKQAVLRLLAMGWWATLLVVLPVLALAIASYALFVVWWIVLLISMIVSPTKQGIHDRIAGSALVRPAGRGNRWAVGCVWILIIVSVLEVAALALLLAAFNAIAESMPFPPGMNPFDYFVDQIRTLWPS